MNYSNKETLNLIIRERGMDAGIMWKRIYELMRKVL